MFHWSSSHFSNFDSLKSTETDAALALVERLIDFSNFDSLKSTETHYADGWWVSID